MNQSIIDKSSSTIIKWIKSIIVKIAKLENFLYNYISKYNLGIIVSIIKLIVFFYKKISFNPFLNSMYNCFTKSSIHSFINSYRGKILGPRWIYLQVINVSPPIHSLLELEKI